jgi:hypothetical protein
LLNYSVDTLTAIAGNAADCGATCETLEGEKRPNVQQPPCSGEKISTQRPRQSPGHAVACGLKVATPIWRKSLQGLELIAAPMRAPPTTNGRGHASQNISVKPK